MGDVSETQQYMRNISSLSHPDFIVFCNNLYYHMQHSPHRVEIVNHLVQAESYIGKNEFPKNQLLKGSRILRQNEVIEKFVDSVQKHYTKERSVGFYADQLCLTPKYLSSIIKENTGKSAHRWIAEFVVAKAKILLLSTNKSIQQISYDLNFPNQSSFGKYFKNFVGISPNGFIRKSYNDV